MADTIPLPPLQPAQIPDFKSNELVQKDGTAPPAGCPQVRQRFWKFFMDEPGHKGHKGHKGDQRRCDERKDTWASIAAIHAHTITLRPPCQTDDGTCVCPHFVSTTVKLL